MENKILKKNCNLIFGPKEENQTNLGRTRILGTYFSCFLSAVIFDCVFRVLSLEKKPETKNSYKIFWKGGLFMQFTFPPFSSLFLMLNLILWTSWLRRKHPLNEPEQYQAGGGEEWGIFNWKVTGEGRFKSLANVLFSCKTILRSL